MRAFILRRFGITFGPLKAQFKRQGFGIGITSLKPGARFWGYEHVQYDGDFWFFGFWYFNFYISSNAYCYLTDEEIAKNVAEYIERLRAEKENHGKR